MKQVLIIHGGTSFSSYDAYLSHLMHMNMDYVRLKSRSSWKDLLRTQLTHTDILVPSMPNTANANYDEWVIIFEKIIPFFSDDVQLVGHSLGAMFLAKYLQDHQLKQPVKRLILLAGAYDDESMEDLGSFKVESATNVSHSAQEVHLFHSKDDLVVPFSELAKFQADMPDAITHTFTDRGHFNTETFPELLELLQNK
ncbi:MAG: alpha/beta hydrolase [Candidatus Saccharimonadales bacterium]